jgi:ubiquinone/menaquinone biosynthesis C-methylase UbiE
MILDWQVQVVEPDHLSEAHPRLRTLLGLGPAARQALGGLPTGAKLVLGVEIDADGTITGTALPPDFAAAAKAAGLQLRVELVADGYEKRQADFARIHGVQDDDLQFMAQMLGLADGARVLDLGCGYGEVSAHIVAESDRLGVRIGLSMCDLHAVQLGRVPPELHARANDVVVGDARKIPFPDSAFDAVVVKMMLHEVPFYDQPAVCEQVLRVLRPGGLFVMWNVMPQDAEIQDAFSKAMQLKNTLAGYESLVRDRYYPRLDQVLPMLTEAGFADVQHVRQVHFRQSTLARRDMELGGSDEKLARLNAFCRSVITADMAKRIDLTDTGDDIQFTITNHIVAARKPQP